MEEAQPASRCGRQDATEPWSRASGKESKTKWQDIGGAQARGLMEPEEFQSRVNPPKEVVQTDGVQKHSSVKHLRSMFDFN